MSYDESLTDVPFEGKWLHLSDNMRFQQVRGGGAYHGASVIGCGDGPEPLLSCRVPVETTTLLRPVFMFTVLQSTLKC